MLLLILLILLKTSKTGIQVLAGYLYYCLFPWLSLKQAIISKKNDIIDFMWAYSLPWFRCSKKNLYAPLTVHHLFVMDMMSEPVRQVWQLHRTGSLRGNRGRNVAWDMFNEKENNDFKRALDGHITRGRLRECATLLNGTKFLDDQFSASWGVEHEDEPSQYCHVKQSDVGGIVIKLEATPSPALGAAARSASIWTTVEACVAVRELSCDESDCFWFSKCW